MEFDQRISVTPGEGEGNGWETESPVDEAEKGLPGRLPGEGGSCGSNYSKLKRLKQQADFISSGRCQALSGLRLCPPAPRLPWQVLPLTRQFQRQVFSLIQQTQRTAFPPVPTGVPTVQGCVIPHQALGLGPCAIKIVIGRAGLMAFVSIFVQNVLHVPPFAFMEYFFSIPLWFSSGDDNIRPETLQLTCSFLPTVTTEAAVFPLG